MSDTSAPTPAPRRRPRREPAPRDWRFWVGGTGRVLLAIGVLMFGFVAYQLWGTGIEYEQHQNSLEREFENRLSELASASTTATTASTASPTTVGPGTTQSDPPSTVPTTISPATTAPAPTRPPTSGPTPTDTAPTDSSTPVPTEPPQIIEWPQISKGDVLAVVEIPSIKKRIYAVAGIDTKNLKRGLGHYPGTPMPGEYGNSAFAGHRTTFGAPLLNVDKLGPGDEIIVTTITNGRYVYVVSEVPRIVSPRDGSVVTTTDMTVATLTLTSCHPKYSAKQRIIITATLDESRSSAAQFPTRIVDPPSREDVDAMTNIDSEVEPDEGSIDNPLVDTTVAGETTDSVDDSTITDAGGNPQATDSNVDGEGEVLTATELAQGWFDDSGAWWHVAGWGLLDLSIIAGGWWLAWFTQRRWLGWVVAALPFLLVLYFVYQNVNRLLPADL